MELEPPDKVSWIWRIPSFIIAGVAICGALLGGFERVLLLYDSVEKVQWMQNQHAAEIKDLRDRIYVLEHQDTRRR